MIGMKFLQVGKELFSTTSDGPLATIPNVPHAKALHPRSQLLQGGRRQNIMSYKFLLANCVICSLLFAWQLCEGGGEIDNPDQRLTADLSSMLASYELIMEADLFILPAATAYYAYKVDLNL